MGRPSPKQLCILQGAWERAEAHGRCCPEEGHLILTDFGEGLVSQGRAEKGLPGGREA